MTNGNVKRWPRARVVDFVADVLFALGLLKAYEWRFVVGIPSHIVFTWSWQRGRDDEWRSADQ